ncbi:MAG: serine/threonine protein kinase [Lachnospiraceae bacterium]|nr:serine/threonine protein kinase [Lachnospiraceae bacterium]
MENNLHIQYIDEKYIKLDLLSNNQGLETWLVKDNCTGKLFILKETMPELAEIYRTLQPFPNKNLAAIYETFKLDNKFIVIEEFISGDTLEEIINKGNTNVHTSFYIIKQILEVLIFLHGINIIHRDINPRNILVSTDGIVKLIDFGIARKYKEGSANDTAILGTAGFAAPEQFGFQQTDARSDIYSLGVLFHLLLSGSMPKGSQCLDIEYKEFIQKCISLDPSMRYQSALEAYTSLVSITTADQVNPVYNKPDNNPYCLPGFRSNTPWKKTLAISFYIIMSIYIFASLKECSKTPASFFLEFMALFLYIIFAFIIVTDYGNWTYRLWPVSRFNKSLKIFIRIILFIFIFYYGATLEEYVRYTMLGIPRPK